MPGVSRLRRQGPVEETTATLPAPKAPGHTGPDQRWLSRLGRTRNHGEQSLARLASSRIRPFPTRGSALKKGEVLMTEKRDNQKTIIHEIDRAELAQVDGGD